MNQRDVSQKLFGREYKLVGTEGDLCIYCGEIAEVLDHVPAIALAEQFKGTFIRVPACRSCNYCLGSKPSVTLLDRRLDIARGIPEQGNVKTTLAIIATKATVKRKYVALHTERTIAIARRFAYINDRISETWNDYITDFETIKELT